MTEPSVALEVSGLGVTYGRARSQVQAIDTLDFSVGTGEFTCVVGPSGCGKTTLLRAMSGLMQPTRGLVRLNGTEVLGPPRELAIVFQEYTRSLLPWMSVARNVMFPLSAQGLSKAEQRERAKHALAEVGLEEFTDKYPWEMSGGMQQRAAIARAIAYRPRVLLMDEPFASVDAQTRSDLEDLMLRVKADTGVTVVFVTHDIDEAVYLGNRVLVLSRRPTTLMEDLTVDLPYPRNQVETKRDPEFVRLRTEISRLIRSKN